MQDLAKLLRRKISSLGNDSLAETQGSDESREDGIIDAERIFQHQTCGFCERTMLAGERTEVYTDAAAGDVFVVCSICRPTARQFGYSKIA